MKLVIQRVSQASVSVSGSVLSQIGKGYLVLLGITAGDTEKEADSLAEKLCKLRMMSNSERRMHLAVNDVGGEMLVVSQFTLYVDTKGGNRPSFTRAARPEKAEPLYEYFVKRLKSLEVIVKTGKLGYLNELAHSQ